jgi:Ca2+-transporting ATPase
MGMIVIAQIVIVQYGGQVFGTVPLSTGEWVRIIVLSGSVLLVGLAIRLGFHRFRSRADLNRSV